MPITDYASLAAAIPAYAFDNSQSVAGQIDTFIQLGQERAQRDLASTWLDTFTAPVALTAGVSTYSFPADLDYVNYIQINRVATGQQWVIQRKTMEYITKFYWPNPVVQATDPINEIRYYGWIGQNQWRIAGTPGAGLTYQLSYRQRAPILGPTVTTNIFTDRYPDVLLAAVICEAFKFKDDPAMVQQYDTMYKEALTSVKHVYVGTTRDDFQTPGYDVDQQIQTTQPG
jgi:hypothetical protein